MEYVELQVVGINHVLLLGVIYMRSIALQPLLSMKDTERNM